jgi:formamidopyrimidine-DNA glycosylase
VPELPEVETFRRLMEDRALDRPIQRVSVGDARILAGVTPTRLARHLKGKRFRSATRHGKQAFLELEDGSAVGIHFGMSGRPVPLEAGEPDPPHARVVFRFGDGTALAFRCPRMFGKVRLLESTAGFIQDRNLGPDALAADLRTFRQAMEPRKGAVKGSLLNQGVLAGIGNVYADEVLFQTGIDPRTPGSHLTTDDHRRLHRSLRRIFKTSLKLETDWTAVPKTWLITHRERNGACPRCRKPLDHGTVAGRTTYWCQSCQQNRSENLYRDGGSR